MDKFIESLKGKCVHILGITGSEGSSILDFCLRKGINNITVHDYISINQLEKNYLLWHKGIDANKRIEYLTSFKRNLKRTVSHWEKDYLTDIDTAEIVFVPQSWRLYQQNNPLYKLQNKEIPFYSLTRLYLDFAPACVIGITGTVGKGSVSYAIVQLLQNAGKRVFFAGNETWRMQVLSKLDQMKSEDFLVLEISHRQLQEGFARAPRIAVLTNLYQNHLDEVSWSQYKKLKYSLLIAQTPTDSAVINFDNMETRRIANALKAKIYFYSSKEKYMNIKSVQELYDVILNTKSNQYSENLLAAGTVASLAGIPESAIKQSLRKLNSLPARLELIGRVKGVNYYDDIKSTTPWATLAAVEKLGINTVLICGGKTKGINYTTFFKSIQKKVKFCIIVESELALYAKKLLSTVEYKIVTDLSMALAEAGQMTIPQDNILLSPAAAFFYTDFIKGKKSFKKLVISLPQEGRG